LGGSVFSPRFYLAGFCHPAEALPFAKHGSFGFDARFFPFFKLGLFFCRLPVTAPAIAFSTPRSERALALRPRPQGRVLFFFFPLGVLGQSGGGFVCIFCPRSFLSPWITMFFPLTGKLPVSINFAWAYFFPLFFFFSQTILVFFKKPRFSLPKNGRVYWYFSGKVARSSSSASAFFWAWGLFVF